ncbi:hypothetical protein Ais01nite_46450 [Asanoa ishikariensis]|nr:hypothetical protein Ais01nite_46450 [Asanoa ishikariensis]
MPRCADSSTQENVGVASSMPSGTGLAFTSNRATDTPGAASALPAEPDNPAATVAKTVATATTPLHDLWFTDDSLESFQ